MIPASISIEDFLHRASTLPVVDVRTPAEYAQGHIPGAVNIPLFTNEERAIVGTLYAKSSRAAAIYRGLSLVSQHASAYLDAAEQLPGRTFLLHCWRGGMRSEGMAQLFKASGYQVHRLDGGYKAYRQAVLHSFSQPLRLRIIGGNTGSGKSEILQELAAMGEQTIDIEALACHKGSAFGALGEPTQPTVEQFENAIHRHLQSFDLSRPIWLEDESRRVGRVIIPPSLHQQMQKAPVYHLEVELDVRINRLMQDYTHHSADDLCAAVEHISRRLGGQTTTRVKQQIMAGDFRPAIMAVLQYYDKTYQYSLSKRSPLKISHISIHGESPRQMAEMLMEKENVKCRM